MTFNSTSSISAAGVSLLTNLEGIRYKPYFDQAGILTVGVGHVITHKDEVLTSVVGGQRMASHGMDLVLNAREVEDILVSDLSEVGRELRRYPQMSVNQMDALAIFIFNIGTSAFNRSTAAKYLLAKKKPEEIALQILRWNKTKGKNKELTVSTGLSKRRLVEATVFLNDITWAKKIHKEYIPNIPFKDVEILYELYLHEAAKYNIQLTER